MNVRVHARSEVALRAAMSGVTLLELLIVLSIMAIVAALVLPMFGGGVSTGELKGAARQVAAAGFCGLMGSEVHCRVLLLRRIPSTSIPRSPASS